MDGVCVCVCVLLSNCVLFSLSSMLFLLTQYVIPEFAVHYKRKEISNGSS